MDQEQKRKRYAMTKSRQTPERPPFARTVRQVAKDLRVRRVMIKNLIALGQIPCYRVGNRVFVDPMAVQAYLDRHR